MEETGEVKTRECKKTKSISEFWKDSRRSLKKSTICRECEGAFNKWLDIDKYCYWDGGMQLKCSFCGEIKEKISGFYKSKAANGWRHTCRECDSIIGTLRNSGLNVNKFNDELIELARQRLSIIRLRRRIIHGLK
jgi:hypothetical protein